MKFYKNFMIHIQINCNWLQKLFISEVAFFIIFFYGGEIAVRVFEIEQNGFLQEEVKWCP